MGNKQGKKRKNKGDSRGHSETETGKFYRGGSETDSGRSPTTRSPGDKPASGPVKEIASLKEKKSPRETDEIKNEVVDDLIKDIKKVLVQFVAFSNLQKVQKEDFELLAVIGRGSFGKVMQVKHSASGKIYAMKILRKDNIIAKNQVTHTKDEKSVHFLFI